MSWLGKCFNILKRKKVLDPETVATETGLARVLTTLDLTALGVGSTLGVGVYVLAGNVAKEHAGPAVILSFIFAGVASIFAGLCYAEFGARAPKAGSAYVYSYVTVGEFIAFVIGWNLILEYVIGAASVSRGLSLYLDKALNDTMKDWYIQVLPIHNVHFLSDYFDLLAFIVPFLLSLTLAFGLKQSSNVNKACTAVNLFVVLFVIIAGSIKADFKNWNLPVPQNNTTNSTINYGNGGFFPFGFEGVIKGAATCFYGFVGFDCIATTGEEVKNPVKAIPKSIFWSLVVIMLAYVGTSAIVTLMVPYYLQDGNAPIPHAFMEIGWYIPMWIVSVGGMFGLGASLFGAMFPLPRILYAMASDGLIFKFLGVVNQRFLTPVIGTILAGILTGLMAALFDLKQLVNMMSIGTLLAYTIVAACVLLLRYSGTGDYSLVRTSSDNDLYSATTEQEASRLINEVEDETDELLASRTEKLTGRGFLRQIFNLNKHQSPTRTSEMLIILEIVLFCFLSLALSLMYMYMLEPIQNGQVWAIVLIACTGLLAILVLMSMATQPTVVRTDIFQVPWVPLFPALSILVNIYLMLMLDVNTWIRFGVWMAIGLPIFFFSVKILYPKKPKKPKESAKKNGLPKKNGHIESNGYCNEGFDKKDLVKLDFDKQDFHKQGIDKHGYEKQGTDKQGIDNQSYNKQGDHTQELNIESSGSDDMVMTYSEVLSDKKTLNDNVIETEKNQTRNWDLEEQETSSVLSVNLVLADLDDTLSREDNRKISCDTMSNMSNAFVEESVVALVHREDVISAPVTPLNENPPLFTEHPLPFTEHPRVLSEDSLNPELTTSDTDNNKQNSLTFDDTKIKPGDDPSTESDSAVENGGVNEDYLGDAKLNAINNFVETGIPRPPPMIGLEAFSPASFKNITRPNTIRKTPEALIISSSEEQTITKVPITSDNFIPPPPPMDEFEVYSQKTMKKVATTPVPDYTPPSSPFFSRHTTSNIESESSSSDNESGDNVQIGSKRYEKVKSNLNNILMKKFLGKSPGLKLTKPVTQQEEILVDQTASHIPILEELKAKHLVKDTEDKQNNQESGEDNQGNRKDNEINTNNAEGNTGNERSNVGNNTDENSGREESKSLNLEPILGQKVDLANSLKTKLNHLVEIDNENESPKPSDIKKKLEEIFRTQPRPKVIGANRPRVENIGVQPVETGEKPVENGLETSENSKRVSNNEAEVNNRANPELKENNDEIKKPDVQIKHKALMANTLASIRLRKVDSFKFE